MDNLGEIRPLSFKTNFKGEIEIPKKEEKFKIFRDESIREIQNTLTKGERVFIFSLRRGLATITVCRDCNQEVLCEKCLAPLVLYLSRDGKKRMFVCNRCKQEANTETVCRNCGSWNLLPLGIGTDTVFEEVKKQFPKIKVFKFDKEVIKTSKEALKIMGEFEKTPGSILVGTEMTLPYINTPLPLSVIASFDSLWSIPNYKISEKVVQIIFSILGKTKEKLIIQTKNEQDPAILAIKTENLLSFVREELKDRKDLGYPPYQRFIKITYLGSREEVQKTRYLLEEMFKEYNPLIFSGFVAKQKNKYVTNALLKINPSKWSLPELSANSSIDENLSAKLLSLPPTFSISVDPEDLL
jgi:primosomal protein N' (replication factor Y)